MCFLTKEHFCFYSCFSTNIRLTSGGVEADHSVYPKKKLRHGDVITWTYFPHYWPFVRGISYPRGGLHNNRRRNLSVTRAPSQYPKRRLSVRSRKVSKPRDLYLELSDRSEIWQALRQQCYRCACQISKRYDNLKYRSRGFETFRDLTERRLFEYWDRAQSPGPYISRFVHWH